MQSTSWTVALSLLLIFGCFASAAAIQMRLDRARALDSAAHFEARRAREIATDLAAVLERYAALGAAFANAQVTPETSAALSEVGGSALLNIAVLDSFGHPLFEMKHAATDLPPLDLETVAQKRFLATSGHTLTAAFESAGKIVILELDAKHLLPAASMEEALLATTDGRLIALGGGWRDIPPVAALALPSGQPETRLLDGDHRRLIALAPVAGWPATTGASVDVGEALSAWYGALPLYIFFIFGPAFAGAGLAVVFVREFERRAQAAKSARTLRATPSADSKLLIRLADAERRASEVERAKTEFIAHMSHDLRTPLNAIIGFADVIAKGVFGAAGHPKYAEYANDIVTAGRTLHTRIGAILDFADLEAGRHPLDLAAIDAAAVVAESIEEVKGRAFAQRIAIVAQMPEHVDIIADRAALKRSLSNLLCNALQFTPPGGTVRVRLRDERNQLVIAVEDSGYGFSPGETPQAGKAFARFDRPGSETGTGLGLAVATTLARRMGGSLRIASRQGEGSTVELRLKRA